MAQANSNNSIPASAVPSRRRFLSQAAGVTAGGAVLALAAIPPAPSLAAPAGALDPVFGLIQAHRTAQAGFLAACAEEIGDPDADGVTEAPCHAAMDSFYELIDTAPTTFAGLQAWASYLDEIREADESMFEEQGAALVVTLAEALRNRAAS